MAITKLQAESLNLADDFTFTGTVAGSASNTPAFEILQTTGTSVPTNTWTKILYDTTIYDTNNAFSSSRFTVPTGYAGKYLFNYQTSLDGTVNGDFVQNSLFINGSTYSRALERRFVSSTYTIFIITTSIINLSEGD